jgi:hypothetical protein
MRGGGETAATAKAEERMRTLLAGIVVIVDYQGTGGATWALAFGGSWI